MSVRVKGKDQKQTKAQMLGLFGLSVQITVPDKVYHGREDTQTNKDCQEDTESGFV